MLKNRLHSSPPRNPCVQLPKRLAYSINKSMFGQRQQQTGAPLFAFPHTHTHTHMTEKLLHPPWSIRRQSLTTIATKHRTPQHDAPACIFYTRALAKVSRCHVIIPYENFAPLYNLPSNPTLNTTQVRCHAATLFEV